jgi:hypothetical protein
MINLLLQAFQACGFATVNGNNWITINMLVVLFSIMISCLIYALANILPRDRREKLKGIVNYEVIEAFFSLVIIAVLIFMAYFVCQTGSVLVGQPNYISLFTSVDSYIGNLLFVNGVNLVSKLYTMSIQFTVLANLASLLLTWGIQLVEGLLGIGTVVPNFITVGFSQNIDALLSAYAGVYTNTYGILLALSFGGLFILFLLIPIVEAGAMTVLAPLSMIFRSLSFVGPQLRKTSNLMLAMAIGLYFVLPLTIGFDSYVAGCMGIGLGIQPVPLCSNYLPLFSQYLNGYSLNAVPSSLFTSPVPTSINATSSTIPGSVIDQIGSLGVPTTFFGKAWNLNNVISNLTGAPDVAAGYGQKVAAYLFLGIVLFAVDSAITIGFVAGLARGLDAMGNLFGVGGFWRE